jgi:hypothetical protein
MSCSILFVRFSQKPVLLVVNKKYYLTRPSKRGDWGAWAGQNVSLLPQILHIYLDETLALISWGGSGVGMSRFILLFN